MRLGASVIGTSNPRDVSYWHVLGRIDQFLIGMLAARFFARVQALTWPRGAMFAVSAVIVLATLVGFNQAGGYPDTGLWKVIWPTLEALVWAQLLMAYALYSERLPGWLSRPLAALGTISYSIYLLHYACITVVSRAPLPKLPLRSETTALVYVFCFVLPLLIPLAALSYYVIERPFLALRVRYLS
jgi:peptidoglycan/LPS O-acetylase OafA/YrhL